MFRVLLTIYVVIFGFMILGSILALIGNAFLWLFSSDQSAKKKVYDAIDGLTNFIAIFGTIGCAVWAYNDDSPLAKMGLLVSVLCLLIRKIIEWKEKRKSKRAQKYRHY